MTAARSLRSLLLAVALLVFASACNSSTTTTTTAPASDDSSDQTVDPTPVPTPAPAGDTDDEPDADPAADTDDEPDDEPAAEPTDEPDDEPAAEPADEPTPEPEPTEAPAASGFASDDDFCRVAREFDESDPFEDADLDPFSPEFFEAALGIYDSILFIAPDEIRADIELIRDELTKINDQLAAIDYDFTDPAFGEILESLDSGVIDAAALRVEAYLAEVCGIDTGAVDEVELDAVDDLPSLGLDEEMLEGLSNIGPEEAALLLGSLGLDPELQQCLLTQLPELTASQDPEILTQEICGTTLLNILSGLG